MTELGIDPWSRSRPNTGTDVPLAHAIGREVIQAGLADRAFIERAVSGFEEYRRLVEPWTPSLAEKVTGVPAAVVRELAQAYARGGDPGGPGRFPESAEHDRGSDGGRALENLSLLTGRIGGDAPARTSAHFHLVRHSPPVDLTDERHPIRLTTGRRLDAHNTRLQTGRSAHPLQRGECVELSPEDAEHYGVVVGEEVRISSRRGSMTAPVWVDPALRPGLAFMSLRLAEDADSGSGSDVGLNRLTFKAGCPIAGVAEFEATAIRVEKLPVVAATRPAS